MAADKTTKVLEVIVDNNKAVSAIAEYNQLIDEQKAKQKELAESYKTGKISQVDYQNAMAKSKEEVKAYSRSVQELSKEVQNNIKDAQEQEGSLRGLRAQLSNLTKEYDALSRAERNGDAGRAKMEEINRITTELKEAEAETQRFYRNVGNYPDVKPLETQLSDIKKQLAQLKFEGKDNTEEFAALAQQAGAMKDALADVEQQINATASDTKNLDTAVMGLTTVMGGLSLLGPMFSDGSEEAEKFNKILQKMQAIMVVLNTLRTIQNNTQKQGLLYQAAESVKLKAINLLKGLEAKATAAQTAATVKQTVAQKALNLVMKANPVLLLVTGFAALASGLAAVASAFSDTSEEAERQKKALEDSKKALEDTTKAFENQVALMEKLGKSSAQILETQIIGLNKIANLALDVADKAYAIQSSKFFLWADWEKVEEALDEANGAIGEYNDKVNEVVRAVRVWAHEGEASIFGWTEAQIQQQKLLDQQASQLRIINSLLKANKITEAEAALATIAVSEQTLKALEDLVKAETESKLEAKREIAAKELALMNQVTDAELALIQDKAIQEEKSEKERHDRAVKELKNRLATEEGLTQTQKDAINRLIEIEEQKHQQKMADLKRQRLADDLKYESDMIKLELEAIEAGTEEELKLKTELLAQERDLELQNIELTEEAKELIREKYRRKEDELRKTYNNKALQEAQELVKLEWENRLNEAANKGQSTLQLEIDAAKARLDALHQLEGESDAEFKARQLAAEKEYIDAKRDLADYEVEITQAKYEALESLVGGLTSIMNAFGEENEKMAKAAKIIALGEIAINTGKAIAAGVAQAQSVPFPANIAAIGTTVATVLANIASAISTVKSAKFATGGLVTGPGTGTSDSIPARLSNGESVINARSTAMFSPILSALNQAGGGVPFNPASSGSQEGFAFIASAVASGMKNANLSVAVDEISRVNRRVTNIKETSKV